MIMPAPKRARIARPGESAGGGLRAKRADKEANEREERIQQEAAALQSFFYHFTNPLEPSLEPKEDENA